ncbi:hypothetical protein Tco_0021635, partial [Tanacetum coccineum]
WVFDEEPKAHAETPLSLDYVPGPEHPPSLDYVHGPEHPPSLDYMPGLEKPEQAPIEDQPLPADASPAALSPGYVDDSDPEENPEEDPADYLVDEGEEEESFRDDADDEDEEETSEDDDDEEHLALVDSSAIPVVDPVPSAEDTEAFEMDESAPTPRAPQIRIPFAQTRLRRA